MIARAILLFAICATAYAQNDFAVCQNGSDTRQGGPVKEFCTGYMYASGRGVAKDMSTAAKHFRIAADAGYAPAEATLGLQYEKGMGVAQDWTEAARWYRKAADAGHAGAALNLGICYQNGTGVPRDPREATKWFQFAAAHGNDNARKYLAQGSTPSTPPSGESRDQASAPANDIFQQGAKLYKAGDYAAALPYFQRAAQAGNPWAELQIGYQYEFGEGVARNYGEAVRWYLRSAQHGNARGQKNLGNMYEQGWGVGEDWVAAAGWYQKSAAQGWVNGQYALGRAYQFGIGVPQSRQKAIEWFDRAAAQGDSEAAYFAKDLRSPGNFIGFRNVAEHDAVIGGKLRFGLIFQEPAGMLFHNSGERSTYLRSLRTSVDQNEAVTMWNIRKSEYDACRSGGGSNCQPPGPHP
jgi:TPR repeat protein